MKMAKKMTEKALAKKLDKMEKEELTKLIIDLYKSNKTAEQAINLLLNGDDYGKELLDKYKNKLYKIFNPKDIVRTGFSTKEAKNVLKEFSDVCAYNNGRWYGDLSLYYAECATEFTMCYGDIDDEFYDALGDSYHDAVVIAAGNKELYELWQERLEKVMDDMSDFGWGMDTYISDEYFSIPWVDEE
jgi:hypothetical protein